MPTLEEAIEQIRLGNREEGRLLLEEILEEDENNEEVWLWLSSVVDTDEDREICLENVLALNPNNVVARKGLEALQSGTFNANELLDEVLEEEEIEEGRPPGTFIDDFMVEEEVDELADEDLIFPETAEKGTKKKKSGGLDIRVVLLGALALVLVLVLVALGGAYFYFVAGADDTGGETTPTQQETEAPAPGAVPTSTDTPTPAPTDTPTATFTPALTLPTAPPTNTPSPTATQVVSPTPANN